MKLELFHFIDEAAEYLNRHMETYQMVEKQLRTSFEHMCGDEVNSVVSFHTRIKNEDSLKEKLLRNHFYQTYETGEDAIHHLSDLIGITIQCRFIRNESELYQSLFQHFTKTDHSWYVCSTNPDIYLNLNMPQPQLQRNGFTIYRLDGFYQIEEDTVNFELQIKSLVHNFWSEIEHEVVYKNPDFVIYDAFNKSMLGAIRDNLDVVDRQLEIMYNEISYESSHAQIGMDENGFKVFVASSINEIVNRKMKESIGFTSDFKKDSAILAQYIYIKDFVNGEHNRERMIDYLEHLSFLGDNPIDFSETLFLEKPFESSDRFCDILGKYFASVMNSDFSWHVFFTMLFAIQPGNNYEDLESFCGVIRMLLIQPGWYYQTFPKLSRKRAETIQDQLAEVLAETLVQIGNNDIVHEDRLYQVMDVFHRFVSKLENSYEDYDALKGNMERIKAKLFQEVTRIFH